MNTELEMIPFKASQYRGNSLIVHDFILNKKELSLGAKLVYSLLAKCALNDSQCYPSEKWLAEQMNCSRKSIQNYLKSLVKAGLVLIQQKMHKTSSHASNIYTLFAPKSEVIAKKIFTSRENFSRVGENFSHIRESRREIDSNNTPHTPQAREASLGASEKNVTAKAVGGGSFSNSLLEAFKELFSAYPRKEAEFSAMKEFEKVAKAKALPVISKLIETVEAFKSTWQWQKENGRYIPRLDRWIKDRRWLDADIQAKVNEREEAKIRLARRQEAEAIEQRELEKAREQRQIKDLLISQEKAKLDNNPSLKARFESLVAKFGAKAHDLNIALNLWLYLPCENISYCFAEDIDFEKYSNHFAPLSTAINDWRAKYIKQNIA